MIGNPLVVTVFSSQDELRRSGIKLVATKMGATQKRAFEISVLERSVIDHIVFCGFGL